MADDLSTLDSILNEAFTYVQTCRECGGEISGLPVISKMKNPDDSKTSAAYIQEYCAKGHLVKTYIMSWALLDKIQTLATNAKE